MEWAQLPIVQLGALGVLLGVLWMVFRGHLVPRATLDDVRADRDARVAEASADADEWRQLYISECQAHELTRKAYATERGAALAASNEGAQIAAALLQEIRARQIGAGS
ncbi:hypothetical protein MF672_038720 [Actinomadura sp. ATCC 31491]|uniref:Uncharacterized protein n=1 Tax=Actinomadura luzonensis TaxID=2805427 RepID=A0ABT0G6F9_9ACTN|nr:hypothetical protein [Actinomadura luzonensis]MCK2219688.1 hypothetical protein [Actinomadura luzonensis]